MSTAFSVTILEHFRRPRRRGALDAPGAAAEATNPLCGDRIRVEVAVRDGRLAAARFHAEACAVCVAAASLLLERVEGGTIPEARAVDDPALLALLDATLPPARLRCATLPLDALRRALDAAEAAA